MPLVLLFTAAIVETQLFAAFTRRSQHIVSNSTSDSRGVVLAVTLENRCLGESKYTCPDL